MQELQIKDWLGLLERWQLRKFWFDVCCKAYDQLCKMADLSAMQHGKEWYRHRVWCMTYTSFGTSFRLLRTVYACTQCKACQQQSPACQCRMTSSSASWMMCCATISSDAVTAGEAAWCTLVPFSPLAHRYSGRVAHWEQLSQGNLAGGCRAVAWQADLQL